MDVEQALTRADGTRIKPDDPDALRVLAKLGILEVVQEADDEDEVQYRMPDPEGVKRALRELGMV